MLCLQEKISQFLAFKSKKVERIDLKTEIIFTKETKKSVKFGDIKLKQRNKKMFLDFSETKLDFRKLFLCFILVRFVEGKF